MPDDPRTPPAPWAIGQRRRVQYRGSPFWIEGVLGEKLGEHWPLVVGHAVTYQVSETWPSELLAPAPEVSPPGSPPTGYCGAVFTLGGVLMTCGDGAGTIGSVSCASCYGKRAYGTAPPVPAGSAVAPMTRAIRAVVCVECWLRWEPKGGAQGQQMPSCPLCARDAQHAAERERLEQALKYERDVAGQALADLAAARERIAALEGERKSMNDEARGYLDELGAARRELERRTEVTGQTLARVAGHVAEVARLHGALERVAFQSSSHIAAVGIAREALAASPAEPVVPAVRKGCNDFCDGGYSCPCGVSHAAPPAPPTGAPGPVAGAPGGGETCATCGGEKTVLGREADDDIDCVSLVDCLACGGAGAAGPGGAK